jgi:glycogen operon protein
MSYILEHRTKKIISPGRFHPLGATVQPEGVNFSIFSQNAEEVFLLLFDQPDGDPTDIIRMDIRTKWVWHCFVPGLKEGQLYGYKVRGRYDPANGFRYNENKLLLDPYARALTGKVRNVDNLLFAFDTTSPSADLKIDTRDSTRVMPKCIVLGDGFDWEGTDHPEIPFDELVIYEAHVKGLTAHPSSKVKNPGTYLGFIEKIPYLKSLGINAVELLPIQEFYVEDFLIAKGVSNYWGYNTIGFFSPDISYSTQSAPGCQVREFQTLVRELHRAGIEVILDVVYNHSGEGNQLGPTFSFKGIDNPVYYRLTGTPDEPLRNYMNYTGCGNSLNLVNSPVIRFVMDSLRYWVEVMRVDGFRFDLASVLGREGEMFEKSSSFFDAISQDPVLSNIKLIAEPWDLGTYQVGNFPVDWAEWNGKFRDTIRKFGKGDGGLISDVAYRITGSSDLYGDDGRSAYNSVNFITCHDGFTLWDLVSYNQKHNEANLEDNRDGSNDNNSWNCGVEGETTDPDVIALRKRLVKNHACMLNMSLGTPMILGGDEFCRTQRGNNNGYCQDGVLTWFDWDYAAKNREMTDFFRKAIQFPFRFPVLQRHRYFTGRDDNEDHISDISWFDPNGNGVNWNDPEGRFLAFRIDGSEGKGRHRGDYQLFFIYNMHWNPCRVVLPPPPSGRPWKLVVDTSKPAGEDFLEHGKEKPLADQSAYWLEGRTIVALAAK